MKNKTKNLTLTALFSVVIAACSWVCIPIGAVPLTLQTFAVSLAGFVLGKKRGSICVALYILMGAVGMPVFSSMQGGISVLLSPTGGFIFGFLPLCFCCGFGKNKTLKILFGFLGVILCHILGVIQMCIIAQITPIAAIISASLPFIVKDFICVAVAFVAASRVKKEINL